MECGVERRYLGPVLQLGKDVLISDLLETMEWNGQPNPMWPHRPTWCPDDLRALTLPFQYLLEYAGLSQQTNADKIP